MTTRPINSTDGITSFYVPDFGDLDAVLATARKELEEMEGTVKGKTTTTTSAINLNEELEKRMMNEAVAEMFMGFVEKYATNPASVREQLRAQIHAMNQLSLAMKEENETTEMTVSVPCSDRSGTKMVKIFLDKVSLKDRDLLNKSATFQLTMNESNRSSILNGYLSIVDRLVQEKKAIYITEIPSSLLSENEIRERLGFVQELGIKIEEGILQKMAQHEEDLSLILYMGFIHVVSKNQDVISFIPKIISGLSSPDTGLKELLEVVKNTFPPARFAALKQSYVFYFLENLNA